jgi:NADH:ubiquinone oxidoreductase subunit 3 (subunit A)
LLAIADYATVGILVLTAIALAIVILAITHFPLIVPKRTGPVKDATYESGMEPIGDTRRRFNVRFYLVAVLFLVFDVEVIFLYPWAVLFQRLRTPGEEHADWAQALVEAGYSPGFFAGGIGFFFVLLLVGLAYEWRKEIFKWN